MALVIMQNHCWGMGDAIAYCWTYHSLKSAGYDVLMNTSGRNEEMFRLFGVPESDWCSLADGLKGDPPKGEGSRNWIQRWMWEYTRRDLPVVRPPYLEDPRDGEWADSQWKGRDLATDSTRRVLVFPEVVYKSRDWGVPHWAATARLLMKEGMNVVVVVQKYDPDHPYPWCQGGHTQRQIAALVARADLVLGNDSGPAHLGGTIGVKTLAVMGPSPKGRVAGHMETAEEVGLTTREMSCVGCNWDYDHGRKFTGICSKSCAALAAYSPLRLVARVKELFHECRASEGARLPGSPEERILRARPGRGQGGVLRGLLQGGGSALPSPDYSGRGRAHRGVGPQTPFPLSVLQDNLCGSKSAERARA